MFSVEHITTFFSIFRATFGDPSTGGSGNKGALGDFPVTVLAKFWSQSAFQKLSGNITPPTVLQIDQEIRESAMFCTVSAIFHFRDKPLLFWDERYRLGTYPAVFETIYSFFVHYKVQTIWQFKSGQPVTHIEHSFPPKRCRPSASIETRWSAPLRR